MHALCGSCSEPDKAGQAPPQRTVTHTTATGNRNLSASSMFGGPSLGMMMYHFIQKSDPPEVILSKAIGQWEG